MPPTTSITNRHLKSVTSPFLSVGYCEVLNGQPAPLNGSILGVNTHRPAPPALNQSNRSNLRSTPSSDSKQSVAFLYGGIFDAQSVTIEKPPLPPPLQRIVDRVVARGGLAGDIDSYDATTAEREGENEKDNASPPPPPAWHCARDTAVRMDAYLANHRSDMSSQQLWMRELNARARGATAANTSTITMGTHTPTSVIDSAHYRDLMTVQLETKRRHMSVASAQDRSRAHAAGAQLERERAAAIREIERARLTAMARRSATGLVNIGKNPNSDNSSVQSATSSHSHQQLMQDLSSPSSPSQSPFSASATCTAAPTVSSPLSPEEALQYLSLADREYLLSVRNSFLHCDRVLRDSQQQLAALRKGFEGVGVRGVKSGSSSSSEEGTKENEKEESDLENKCLKLAEAATWAKGHLRSITSDGSSALWFTAVPNPPLMLDELPHGMDQRLSAKEKIRNSNQPPAVTQTDIPSAACTIQAQGQTQQEKRKGRSLSPVKLSLFSTGNSRAVRVKPELIAAYLVANGVDLDAFAAYLEKELTTAAAAAATESGTLNKAHLSATAEPSASDRISHCARVGDEAASENTKEEVRQFTDPNETNKTRDLCPWRWSAFEAQRAAKALERKAKANAACPSELYAHPNKASNNSDKEATAPIAMRTEQTVDMHIAESRGCVLPNDLFGSSCAQAVDLRTHSRCDHHHDVIGGNGRGVSDSLSLVADWDFAKTIAGRGSLISFAQGYRSRNIKGLCTDHTPENTTERRRCNLAAQGRNYNTVKEVATCAISDENIVVSDNFDAGLYLANSRKDVDVLPTHQSLHLNANKMTPASAPSSSSFKIDVPVLTLQPPSLVTRALGLIRYKLNPSLGPHEQVIVPVPEVDLSSSSSSSAAGGTTELELEHGEVVILCSRSVFESEASDNYTFAADGATIDDVVEAVLQGILVQVARNIEACTNAVQKTEANNDGRIEGVNENAHGDDCVGNSKDVKGEVRRALEYVTAVDVKALASDVCSIGLDCGTKKSLQAMVAVVPPRSGDEQTLLRAASSSQLELPTTPDPLLSGFLVSEAQVTHNTRLTTSFLPSSPLSVGHLKADPLFRVAFCDDIKRSGLSLIDFVKMRFKLLRRALLASSSSSTPCGHKLPVYSVSNVGAAEWKSANHLLNSCFPTVGAEMRRALRSEAVLFGDGPPQFSTKGEIATGAYEQKVDNYYRSIAREIFGRHRVNKE